MGGSRPCRKLKNSNTNVKLKLEIWVETFYKIIQSHWQFVLLVLFFITIFFGFQLPRLSFNYDIEGFFSVNDPEVVFYEKFKTQFGNENNALIIGIESDSGIFKKEFMSKLDILTKALGAIPEIENVLSPSNVKEYIMSPLVGFQPIPAIHISDPSRYETDSIRIYKNQSYSRMLFSNKSSSVAIILEIVEGLNHSRNEQLLSRIVGLISNEFRSEAYHLAGRIQTQHYYINTMKSEMAFFSILALILFCGSIWLIFRRFQFVIITLTVIATSLIWTFGIMSLFRVQLDLMLTILPTLIFVLSTSIAIHLLNKFQELFSLSGDKLEAIKESYLRTTVPNLLISFTTSTGIASLYFIPVVSIQRFGLFAAGGILIAMTIGLVLIPIFLRLLSFQKKRFNHRNMRIDRVKLRLISIVCGRSRNLVGLLFIMLVLISLIGVSLIKINNSFLDDLSHKSNLKQDLMFFEDQFSGIRPFELVVSKPKNSTSIFDYENIRNIESIENYIRTNYGLGMVQSPITLVKSLNVALNGGNPQFYRVPESEKTYDGLISSARRYKVLERFGNIIDQEGNSVRISGRIADAGRLFYLGKDQGFQKFMANQKSNLDVNLTGVAYLIDNANSMITESFMLGLSLVIFVVILVIRIYSTSAKLTFLALGVNLVPLLVVGGIMGGFDIPLKISTALIFTIVLGIGVDDTIHFLHRYIKLLEGYHPRTAVKLAMFQMTSPIILTTSVLFSGFMIFSFSSFESIQTLGWLTSIALIVAMLTDLVLLPRLLILLNANQNK